MNSVYPSYKRPFYLMLRPVFVWIMTFSLLLQTSAVLPLVADANVLVNVSHSDGTTSTYDLKETEDDIIVSYSMGETDGSGAPTLDALSGLLGLLDSSLTEVKAETSCTGNGTATASASVTDTVTIEGETVVATASAQSTVTCSDGETTPVNTPPSVTLLGGTPMSVTLGTSFVDPGANATDAEDCVGLTQSACNTALSLTATGVVNTNTLGTYTITYTARDSSGALAVPVTRTVIVIAPSTTECRAPSDIMLAIDRSGSMNDDGTNPDQPMTFAKDAAKNFIDSLSATDDRVGVVSFSTLARLDVSLTNDFPQAKSALTGLIAEGWTNIAEALLFSSNDLTANGRTNARQIIILLSDGRPEPDTNAGTVAAIQNANSAKAKGYVIYTIGLGSGISAPLMQEIATSPAHYFFAASGTDLDAIYQSILSVECALPKGSVSGHKYHDVDANGSFGDGDTVVSGWGITLTPNSSTLGSPRTVTTDSSGAYTFTDVQAGDYTLCEASRSGWTQVAPTANNGCYLVSVVDNVDLTGKNFYNKEQVTPPVNTPPSITLLGANPLSLTVGASFTDPGANATDAEDCVGLTQSACNTALSLTATGVVNTGSIGTYTVTYTARDSQGLQAIPVTRTVNVIALPPPDNTPPVITVLGNNPLLVRIGTIFTDPGATAADAEDGNITDDIVKTGTVNTAQVGNYTIRYNVTDSDGAAATEKTRTVTVFSACSDGLDNDGDETIDLNDEGCTDPNDDSENEKPVIELIGETPMSVTLGATFTDPGANATDTEDCIGLTQSACNTALQLTATGVVNTNTLGTYTITYTARDSEGLEATPVTRTVNVVSTPPPANTRPVITLLGADPLLVRIGTTFADPGANATDAEDCVGLTQSACNTALQLTATGTVNIAQVGNYTITYTAKDSRGLEATPVTRTVTVFSACSDGVDNDGDETIDLNDEGCTDPNDDSENEKPVITLLGNVAMQLILGTTFTDPGANATDAEDCVGLTQAECNEILDLTATGTVNTTQLGTYTITYTARDSEGLQADPKTRTVSVIQQSIPGCTSNCGGGETNTRPVITMLGNNPISVQQNTTFTDPGATAWDSEDGDITSKIIVSGTVDTTRLGSYNIAYNVTDSKGLPAQERTRTVNVVPCTSNCGGGGGGGSVTLSIYNERLAVTGTTTVVVTWNTNIPADSRVVYGLNSVTSPASAPYYGYPLTTATSTTYTTTHSMTITGIPSMIATYYRPVSTNGALVAVGRELTRAPEVPTVIGGSCEYLKEYLRIGYNNNPTEVLKLQLFLKNFEGFANISTSGFFDEVTDRSVRIFQDRYAADILTPWNLPGNTGYVYYTTKKKINEIYCQREFPLTPAQLAEIAEFRELIRRIGAPVSGGETVTVPTSTGGTAVVTVPVVGRNDTQSSTQGAVAGAATVSNVPGAATSTATGTQASSGRNGIALADLLATSPSVGRELQNGEAAYDTGVATSVSGDPSALLKQNAIQAAIGAISDATHISEKVLLAGLLFLIILIIVAVVIVWRMIARRKQNEMKLPKQL